jgi:hypothetical protein
MEFGILDIDGSLLAKFTTPLTVKSNQPIFVSDTLSLQRKVTKRSSSHRWEIDTNLAPLKLDANDLFAFIVEKGLSETVKIKMPQNYAVVVKLEKDGLGKHTDRLVIDDNITNGNLGTSTIKVTGTSYEIPRGTFVSFTGSNPKMYMTTSESTPSVNGVSTINIFPALVSNVTGEYLKYKNVEMTCKFDTSVVIGMTYSDGVLMDNGTFKLLEHLV